MEENTYTKEHDRKLNDRYKIVNKDKQQLDLVSNVGDYQLSILIIESDIADN